MGKIFTAGWAGPHKKLYIPQAPQLWARGRRPISIYTPTPSRYGRVGPDKKVYKGTAHLVWVSGSVRQFWLLGVKTTLGVIVWVGVSSYTSIFSFVAYPKGSYTDTPSRSGQVHFGRHHHRV